jgi:hypothetical protein
MEMGRIQDGVAYDFNALFEAEGKRIDLPEQLIPPDGGRIEQPEHMKIYLEHPRMATKRPRRIRLNRVD